MKKKLLVLLLAASMTITGLGAVNVSANADDSTLTIAIAGEMLSLDPGVATGSTSYNPRLQIFDRLVDLNSDGTISPNLAESWDYSDDGKDITFHLRKGVKFHDGSDFTSEDVKRTFDRMLNAEYGSTRQNDIMPLESVETTDDYTVVFHLSAPSGNFLNKIGVDTGDILSADDIDKYGEDLATNANGTGPYKIKDFTVGESCTLEANEDYWGGAPAIKTVVMKTVSEASTRANMLLSGEAEFVEDVSTQDIDSIESSGKASVRYDETNRVLHIGMNTKMEGLDVKVRQAINYAVDRDTLVKAVLDGAAESCNTVIAPNVWGWTEGQYTYDPDKAKELIKEAGAEGLKIELWTPEGHYYHDKETALVFADMMKAVGLDVEVKVCDWSTMLSDLRLPEDETKNQMWLFGWEAATCEGAYSLRLFSSDTMPPDGWNISFYQNDTVDDLYVKANETAADDQRKEYLKEAYEQIDQDAVWCPLAVYTMINAQVDNLEGVDIDAIQMLHLKAAHYTE